MSIAWNTLLLVILILPGIAFLLGLYTPERYSRDVGRRNAIGELGIIVFIALIAHIITTSLFFLADDLLHVSYVSGVIDDFFVFDINNKYELAYLTRNYLTVFVLYVLFSVLLAYVSGYICGRKVISGRLRFLARHRWLYELIDATKKPDSSSVAVIAYVMTSIRQEERVLMYKGILQEFFMTPEGKIAHLVLKNCSRFYMHLHESSPSTNYDQLSLPIEGDEDAGTSQWLYLVIEGEEIANVVFEATAPIAATDAEIERLLKALMGSVEMQESNSTP